MQDMWVVHLVQTLFPAHLTCYVSGVCEMCMCLARGGVGGEGGELMRGLGLGLPILWE